MARGERVVRCLVALAVAGVAMLSGPAVQAETAVHTGWWWVGRPTAATPTLLRPSPAPPDGGLYVGGSVTGPIGMAALRYMVPDGADDPVLTLTVSETTGDPAVRACRAATPWDGIDGGPWDQRPRPDCSVAVDGVVAGTSVTFALGPLMPAGGDTLDVMLVPVEVTTGSSGFSTAFAPVDATSIATSEAAPATPPDASAPVVTNVAPPVVDAGPAVDDAGPGLTLGPVSTPEVPAPSIRPAAPAAPAAPTAPRRTQAPVAASTDLGGFAYPFVLALPLVLLAAATYLGRSLTQPVLRNGIGLQ